MPARSQSTKRKKPPRVDSDKSSSESNASDDEITMIPPKNLRINTTLTPTSVSGATRTPHNTSIARRMRARREVSNSTGSAIASATGSRTATPPPTIDEDKDTISQDMLTPSQSQLTKLNTPQQGRLSKETTTVTPTTLGMPTPRRTYSQMRTFLMPIEDPGASEPGVKTSSTARLVPTMSYNDLVLSESQEELQQDTAEKNITFNGETDLRSITEMRVKGESRRFGDDVEYVLEGLEGESVIRVRRASAVEFVGRMCEAEFVQRARASDVLSRAWGAIHQSVVETSDRVFDAIAGLFVSLVAREFQDVPGALQNPNIPSIFCTILHRARDLDGLEAAASDDNWAIHADVAGKIGLGKVERKQLSALLVICEKAGVVPPKQTITTQILVSHGLSLVIPKAIAQPLLLNILSTVSVHLQIFDTRLSGHITGLNIIPPSNTGVVHTLQVTCSLLRGCQVAVDNQQGQDSDDDLEFYLKDKEVETFVRRVVIFCRISQILMASDPQDLEDGVAGLAGQCAIGSLKILVLLTSDARPEHPSQPQSQYPETSVNYASSLVVQNPLVFHVIARFVSQDGDPSSQSSQFEHACLALALLLNLVKGGAGGAKQVKSLSVYSACPLSRKCAIECTCKSRKPHLDLYTGLYQRLQSKSTIQDDFHSTFLLGYLAVLLGLLIVNDESIKDAVYEGLPGPSGSNKFEDLAQSIEQFVHAYERVAQATKIKGMDDRVDHEDNHEEDTMIEGGSGVALAVAKRLRDIS